MQFELEILQSAKHDTDKATEYYYNISEAVFDHFNQRLDEALLRIQNNPFFEIRFRNIRALPLRVFPYLILFEIDESAKIVYILSVFCTHQDPEKYP